MEKEFFFIFPFFSFFLSFFFVLLFNARMSVASSGMETKMATIMPPLLQPSAECGATRPFLPTTASIRRCAIWSTTAYKKSRLSHRSRLPRRRVLRWTAPHRAALSSSPKLYALTMTTILLKGKFQTIWMLFKIIHPHVCPDVVPWIFFFIPAHLVFRSTPSLSGLDSPLPPPPVRCCCIQGCVRKKAVLKDGRRPAVSSWQRYWIQLSASNLLFYQAKHLRG